jgi:hypothetical protein
MQSLVFPYTHILWTLAYLSEWNLFISYVTEVDVMVMVMVTVTVMYDFVIHSTEAMHKCMTQLQL